ncbi:MAG TPA: septal ring lytic transglycosylase RlpA family protein [Burkholderiales bacterium]|nr:septal ring lytic transglycosylase RlpA family protein [Burkholderiales bacterium]
MIKLFFKTIIIFTLLFTNFSFANTYKHKHYKIYHKKYKHKYHKKNNYMAGIASYYGDGDGFNGQQMANGDYFDTNNMSTAAHPTLRLGTKLKVTNLSNNRSVYVEVRDRMPKRNRVIDLSTAAAKYLGMYKKGITRVKLEIISNSMFKKNKNVLEVDLNDSGTPY